MAQKSQLAAPPATDAARVSGVRQGCTEEREAASSSRGSCIPGPWWCVAFEHKGPLLFPGSTSRQQGGPDAPGFMLLNSNEVPRLQPASPHTCSEGTPIRHCPAREAVRAEAEGTPRPFVVPCLFTMSYSASNVRAARGGENGTHFQRCPRCFRISTPSPRSAEQVN